MAFKTKIDLVSTINVVFLSFLIVWQPLRMLLLQVDGKGRIPFLFTLFVAVSNLVSNRGLFRAFFQKPFVFWLLWIVYAFCNMMIKGYHYGQNTPLFFLINNLVTPLLSMVVAYKESISNRGFVCRVLIISFALYCVLGFFFMGRVRSEDDSLLSLGNNLAIYGSFLIYILCVGRTEKVIPMLPFGAFILLSLLMIIVTATRKAFGSAVIIIFFYVLSGFQLKPSRFFLLIIIAVGAYFSVDYLLDNTYLGERLVNNSDYSNEALSYSTDNVFLRFVGDRAPHYILGWVLFVQNPITGIGLYNFMFSSGYIERLHTDYMVQLTENGILGFLLFFFFVFWFIIHSFRLRRTPLKNYSFLGFGWVFSMLFLGITAWTYDMVPAFICYGVTASLVCSHHNYAR